MSPFTTSISTGSAMAKLTAFSTKAMQQMMMLTRAERMKFCAKGAERLVPSPTFLAPRYARAAHTMPARASGMPPKMSDTGPMMFAAVICDRTVRSLKKSGSMFMCCAANWLQYIGCGC